MQTALDKFKGTEAMKIHAFLAASLGILFDAMDASIYFMVLHPCLADLLHTTSDAEIGHYGSIILCLFMVGWAVGSLVFGILADKIGRSRTMVLTIILYAICTGLCATSSTWIELGIYRFLVGVGIGGEISIGAVMLCEFWTGRGRIFACCLLESAFCLGYLATSLANLGIGELSWRPMFLIGLVPAIVALYIRIKLKEPENFQKVQAARNSGQDHSSSSAMSTLQAIFSSKWIATTVSISTLTGVAIVGYWAALSWIPAWINQLTGTVAVEERSTAGIVMNVSGVIACVLTGLMIEHWGRKGTLKITFLGSLLSTVLMFLTVQSYGTELLCWLFFVGFFTSVPFVVLVIMIPEMFVTELLATASGFAFSAGRLVAALAALASGEIIGIFGGSYAAAGASVGLVYAIGFLASYFVPATTGEVLGTEAETHLESANEIAPALS